MLEKSPERARAAELLDAIDTPLTAIAYNVLLESRRADCVAVDAAGRVHVILGGAPGEDAALLTRVIAAREWLGPRLADWVQLAPERGIDAQAAVAAVVVCPSFEPETRTANATLNEPVHLVEAAQAAAAVAERISPVRPRAPVSRQEAPQRARFRTGLRDEDLGLTR